METNFENAFGFWMILSNEFVKPVASHGLNERTVFASLKEIERSRERACS